MRLLLAVPVCGVVAMHEVCRGRWSVTLLRGALVTVIYDVELLLATALLVLGLLAVA
jgi:hypothetical protein